MPRPRALLIALLAASTALVVNPVVAPAASETAEPVAGSDQGGDPYYPWDGNGGYDVRHYRVVNTFRPRSGWLRGRTEVQATAGDLPLRSLSLDLVLQPDWVEVDGVRADFAKPRKHELRVTPRQPVAAGEEFEVAVGYRGHPARIRAKGVRPFVWAPGEAMAIGEPQIASWWFAANETPADKASFDVTIRVPRGLQAVSNGSLLERKRARRLTTWRWRQAEPIATYLAFFAAGRFELRRRTVDGRETVYAVSKRLRRGERTQSFRLLERTPAILDWLEEWLGTYPYTTSGGVVSSLWAGFALENAGRPTYPFVGGPRDRWNVGLVVHELAHQWFGNDVSLRRWRDIWLNEGLASYAEWAWAEERWADPVAERLDREHEMRGADSSFWKVVLSDPGPQRVFAPAVYERGAMTVAALRCRIGAGELDALLRRWVVDNARGWGTVEEFRDLAEEVSGRELDDFFAAWLDTPGKPAATPENGFGCT